MRVPTVAIIGPDGDRRLINRTDFDPQRHKPWEERAIPEGPTDPAQRSAEIQGAIAKLDPQNSEHYTQQDQPRISAISAILGYEITAAERDAALTSA